MTFLRTLNFYFRGFWYLETLLHHFISAVAPPLLSHGRIESWHHVVLYLFSVWAPAHWIRSVQCIGCYLNECALHRVLINDSFDDYMIALTGIGLRGRRNVYNFLFGSYSRFSDHHVIDFAKTRRWEYIPSLIHSVLPGSAVQLFPTLKRHTSHISCNEAQLYCTTTRYYTNSVGHE